MSERLLVLEVVAIKGMPPTEAVRGAFDIGGGLIGRSAGNSFSLPDPERQVSRVHAQVVPRPQGVAIVVRGRNGILVDGEHLQIGEEELLRDGSMIEIGPYRLRAAQVAGSASRLPTQEADSVFVARQS